MKATGLFLTTLSVVALAQAARQDYVLQCTSNEMGIRWPSYKSNSEYYVCHRLGARPMIVPCSSGEVFTFVLQMCTSPSRFIPAPAIEILPTDSPIAIHNTHYQHDIIKPLEINNVAHPPIYGESNHHVHPQMVPQTPPVVTIDLPRPPALSVIEHKNEPEEHTIEEPVPQEPARPPKPAARPPMPPTPAPTPPVVGVETVETTKKPQANSPKKPTAEKKKAPAKPSTSDDKKAPKKTPKKPTNTKTEKKAPGNTPKKPPTSVKKAPKAPTKA